MDPLELFVVESIEKIKSCSNLKDLNDLRVQVVGKNSPVTQAMSLMGKLSPQEKAAYGQRINGLKSQLNEALDKRKTSLEDEELRERLMNEKIDISLPGTSFQPGAKHPIQLVIDEISDICIGMGFRVAEGPEVETDHYNFEMLNLPKEHPARDMQDTFYLDENTLLRTQTSPVQVRAMLEQQGTVPVKIICPGKVYRRDDDDATHSHQFNQIEGLLVDRNVTLADLYATLDRLAKAMFGEKRSTRLRSSYFPFTEPSVELDVSCYICDGKGCNVCKHTGWIEILGAGMVHPQVLKNSGYNPEINQGFAFGIGVDRIAMLRYGIDDIRHLYNNDLRFLKQFIKER